MLGVAKHVLGITSGNIHEWTMDCNSNAIATFNSPLVGSNGNLDIFTLRFFHIETNNVEFLLDSSDRSMYFASDIDNTIYLDGLINPTLNGVTIVNGVTVLTEGYYELIGTMKIGVKIDFIAADNTLNSKFKSQVHYLSIDAPLMGF